VLTGDALHTQEGAVGRHPLEHRTRDKARTPRGDPAAQGAAFHPLDCPGARQAIQVA
jgi:hypothetical protein